MLSFNEKDILEIKSKIPTVERAQANPGLVKLRAFEEKEELDEKWHKEYLNAYSEANELRGRGDHNGAILCYRNAQSIVYYVKERGLVGDAIPLREAACHYMIIQCYSNIQEAPEHVMREFHNFSLVLLDMLEMIVEHDDDAEGYLGIIEAQLKEDCHVDPILIFNTLRHFYDKIKYEEEDSWVIGWIWKLSYFITRYSTIAHDFFMKCTPHLKVGRAYDRLTKEAGELAEEALSKLPNEYFENDKTGINKIYAKVTKNWTGIYYDVLSAEASNIFGDYTEKVFQFTDDHEKYLWGIISSYQNPEDSKIFPEDYEHAIELLALNYFTDACISLDEFKSSLEKLQKLYSLACDSKNCERVACVIQMYIARAALRYNELNLASCAYENAHHLHYGEGREASEGRASHIFDIWLRVINSEILLKHHEVVQKITSYNDAISSKVSKTTKFSGDCGYNPDHHLGIISSIEKIFGGFKSEDSKIERSKLSFLPLEAKIYFILGLAGFEKAKILAKDLRESKKDENKNGDELLKTFYEARRYLCESYNILQNMDYKDSEMLGEIADTYIKLIDFNYDLSGLPPSVRKWKVPAREEIPELVKHYQLQKWVDILYESVRTKHLSYDSDYATALAGTLKEGIKCFLPNLSDLCIAQKNDGEWNLKGNSIVYKEGMCEEALEKSDADKISEHYFYHQKNGKFMVVVPVGCDGTRKLVIEVSYPMTDCDKDLISEIASGVEILLKVFDKRKRLEEFKEDSDLIMLKRDLLEEVFSLFKYLLKKHENTIFHSEDMAKVVEKKRNYERGIRSKLTEGEKDTELQIEFAYKLHDFGKVELDPKLILDKATKLLPHEIKHTNNHAMLGAELLRSLLGLKHFKYLIALSLAHHVKYGIDKGYPFVLPGDEIEYIIQKMGHNFENLSEYEKKFIADVESILPDEISKEARDIAIIDQIQALRDSGRAYRTVMPLDNLNGYLLSKSGRDFDPDRVEFFINLARQGLFDEFLAHNEKDIKKLHEFKLPKNFEWDDIYETLVDHREEFERHGGIDLSSFIDYMEKGKGLGLKMSESCFGAGICEMFIEKVRKEVEEMPDLRPLKEKSPSYYEKMIRESGVEEFSKKKNFYLSKFKSVK